MKRLVFLISIVVFFTTLQGQYVTDALRYSQNFPAITTRSMGMGGAFSSLGGDFSSTYYNPAGLGLYRKSEFQFTPVLNYANTDADYLGQKSEDIRYHFNVGSLGYVGTYNTNKDKGLVSASFATGYIRRNTFNSNTSILGRNPDNSLADYFMINAEGNYPEDLDAFYERLAFDGYIIDTVPGMPVNYQTPVLLPIDQTKTIDIKGGVGEYNFAFGLNFSNVVYAGIGFGFQQLRYNRYSVHSEFDTDQNDFSRFHFREDLDVDGHGFSMNMGMMVRLMKIMRVGVSLQIPTYYHITEYYYNTLSSDFDNGDHYDVLPTDAYGDELAAGNFSYKLNTPLRVQGGLSVQIGTMGIVSADLEFINYANMHLEEDDGYMDFSGSNSDIEEVYKSVVNLKVGGEVRFNNLFLRMGGGYYPSPCSSIKTPDIYSYIGNVPDSYWEFATGVGYRIEHFFFDLGFSRIAHDEKYNLYFENVANLSIVQYRFMATTGIRF